ncbi:hypothetical protein HK102_011371 [Quaeritorhiza haematococci]|nr:hypothetical protein HK102_011371 [Quaeritorhiza haematococci]
MPLDPKQDYAVNAAGVITPGAKRPIMTFKISEEVLERIRSSSVQGEAPKVSMEFDPESGKNRLTIDGESFEFNRTTESALVEVYHKQQNTNQLAYLGHITHKAAVLPRIGDKSKIKMRSQQAVEEKKARTTVMLDDKETVAISKQTRRATMAAKKTSKATAAARAAAKKAASATASIPSSADSSATTAAPSTATASSTSSNARNSSSSPDAKDREGAVISLRTKLIHMLALAPRDVDWLRSKLPNSDEEIAKILQQIGQQQHGGNKWQLKAESFKEVKPWDWRTYSYSDRQAVVKNATIAFDFLKLPPDAPERKILVPPEKNVGLSAAATSSSTSATATTNATSSHSTSSSQGALELALKKRRRDGSPSVPSLRGTSADVPDSSSTSAPSISSTSKTPVPSSAAATTTSSGLKKQITASSPPPPSSSASVGSRSRSSIRRESPPVPSRNLKRTGSSAGTPPPTTTSQIPHQQASSQHLSATSGLGSGTSSSAPASAERAKRSSQPQNVGGQPSLPRIKKMDPSQQGRERSSSEPDHHTTRNQQRASSAEVSAQQRRQLQQQQQYHGDAGMGRSLSPGRPGSHHQRQQNRGRGAPTTPPVANPSNVTSHDSNAPGRYSRSRSPDADHINGSEDREDGEYMDVDTEQHKRHSYRAERGRNRYVNGDHQDKRSLEEGEAEEGEVGEIGEIGDTAQGEGRMIMERDREWHQDGEYADGHDDHTHQHQRYETIRYIGSDGYLPAPESYFDEVDGVSYSEEELITWEWDTLDELFHGKYEEYAELYKQIGEMKRIVLDMDMRLRAAGLADELDGEEGEHESSVGGSKTNGIEDFDPLEYMRELAPQFWQFGIFLEDFDGESGGGLKDEEDENRESGDEVRHSLKDFPDLVAARLGDMSDRYDSLHVQVCIIRNALWRKWEKENGKAWVPPVLEEVHEGEAEEGEEREEGAVPRDIDMDDGEMDEHDRGRNRGGRGRGRDRSRSFSRSPNGSRTRRSRSRSGNRDRSRSQESGEWNGQKDDGRGKDHHISRIGVHLGDILGASKDTSSPTPRLMAVE